MNKFQKAIRYTKPLTEIDEKIRRLDEAMRTSGLYTVVDTDPGVDEVSPTFMGAPLGDFSADNLDSFEWNDQGDDPEADPDMSQLVVTDALNREIPRFAVPGVTYTYDKGVRTPDYSLYGGNVPLGIGFHGRAINSQVWGYLTSGGFNSVVQQGVFTTPGPKTELQQFFLDRIAGRDGGWGPYTSKTIYLWGPLDCLGGSCYGASEYSPAGTTNSSDPLADFGLYAYTMLVPKSGNEIYASDAGVRVRSPRVNLVTRTDNLGDPGFFPGLISNITKAVGDVVKSVINTIKGITESIIDNLKNNLDNFVDTASDMIGAFNEAATDVLNNYIKPAINFAQNIADGISDGLNLVNRVKGTIRDAYKNGDVIPPTRPGERPTIREGAPGSKSNPIKNELSKSARKTLTNHLNKYDADNNVFELKTHIQDLTSTGLDGGGHLGLKATHNNLAGDTTVDSKGDVHIQDTYGFGPSPDIRNKLWGGVGAFADAAENIYNALGGDGKGASEAIQTFWDQGGPVGAIAGELGRAAGVGGGMPDQNSPLVHFETTVPSSDIPKDNFKPTLGSVKESVLFEKWKKKEDKKKSISDFQAFTMVLKALPPSMKKVFRFEIEAAFQIAMLSPDEKSFKEKEIKNSLINKYHDVYVDDHFPENKEQTSRVKKILARNIELSDPKTFKDPKPALTYGKVFGEDSKDKKVKIKDPNRKSAARFFVREKKKKLLRHLEVNDLKKTHQRCLDEQRALYLERKEREIRKLEEAIIIKELSEPYKSDWRSEINEAMTSSEVLLTTLNPTDAPLTTLDGGDAASFNNDNGGPNLGSDNDGLSGCTIVSSGTGSGSSGGFNLGQNYLAFNQSSFDDGDEAGTQNLRFAVMAPMDASRATTLEVTAIVGNGSNGGDAPESGEDIVLAYASGPNSFRTIQDDQGNDIVVVPHNGSGSLQTYSVTIPTEYRVPNISFILRSRQNTLSLSTQDNYGITEIKLKRTSPMSVLVSLDSPEATSFIRTDPIMQGLSAEGRRKRLEDMLDAGNEYLLKQLGIQGSLARPADTGNIVSWQQAASGITRTNTSRTSSSKSKSTSIFGNSSSRSRTFGSFGGRNFGSTTNRRFGSSQSISSTAVSQQLYKNDLKAAGYSDKQIAQKTNVRYIAPKKNIETAKAKASASKTSSDINFDQQKLERDIAWLKGMGKSFAQGYLGGRNDAEANAIRSALGMQTRSTSTSTSTSTSPAQAKFDSLPDYEKAWLNKMGPAFTKGYLGTSPPQPPTKPQPQNQLTPQQLANIEASLKQLEIDKENDKKAAAARNLEFAANLAMDALTVAALLSPIPGDEAAILAARGGAQVAKQTAKTTLKQGVRQGVRQGAKSSQYKVEPLNVAGRRFDSLGRELDRVTGRRLNQSYEPQGQVISEKKLKSPKEVLNNKIPGYYDGKPAPLGFPDNPPPEMVNGMHPDLVDGKKVADRFNRLDPQSAQAMPPTGNPHIDKKVKAARKKSK